MKAILEKIIRLRNPNFNLHKDINTVILISFAWLTFFEFALFTFQNNDKAWFCTLLFILFPFNYFYSMFYTYRIK